MERMNLDQFLTNSGKTQEQLAAELGVSQGAVSRWATGKKRPRDHMKLKIEKLTGGKVPAAVWLEGHHAQ